MPKIFSEEEKKLLREKLLQYGIHELEHRRYRNISVDEVTDGVGIAKGTFYHFFASKESYFYEIMQLIKTRNRKKLVGLLERDHLSKEDVAGCLYERYTETKTVYDYFTPEEMRIIVRKLENGDEENDSAQFAADIIKKVTGKTDVEKAGTVVAFCNMLALAESNRDLYGNREYQNAIRVFSDAVADYIFREE
ncbi:MAG: TetR/AcrR family transcriptional regulator [Eubacteriales bacterium]|nr:TetR/AcrR family transcriptional regulator [Eubacteriales bacterium]